MVCWQLAEQNQMDKKNGQDHNLIAFGLWAVTCHFPWVVHARLYVL
jgi:hypothetical protein